MRAGAFSKQSIGPASRKTDRRAWLQLASIGAIWFFVMGGTLASCGLLLEPAKHDLGASTADIGAAFSLLILSMTVISPALGWACKRYSVRAVIGIGLLAIGLGYCWASFSQDAVSFAIAMLVTGAGIGAATYIPGNIIIASWFDEGRGFALGVLFSITALGTALLPYAGGQLIAGHGWRLTMQIVSGVVLGIGMPIALLIVREAPSDHTASAKDDIETAVDVVDNLTRRRAFRLLLVSAACAGFALQGVYLFILDDLSRSGFSLGEASFWFGAVNVVPLFGCPLFGWLADEEGPVAALLAGLLAAAVATPTILVSDERVFGAIPAIAGFALLWGATSALPGQLAPLILAKIVRSEKYGAALGAFFVVYGIAQAIGPIATGALADSFGGYKVPFIICALSFAIAAAVLWPLRGCGQPRRNKTTRVITSCDYKSDRAEG